MLCWNQREGKAVGKKGRLAALVLVLALLGSPPAEPVRAVCWASGGAAWAQMENPGCRSARVELELWLDRRGSGQRQVRTGVLAPGESRTFFLGRAEGVRPGRLESRGIF